MALNVYFREDVRSAILAGLVATVSAARASGQNVEYLRGALAGFQHQALAFGILWQGARRDEYDHVEVGILDQAFEMLRWNMVELIEN